MFLHTLKLIHQHPSLVPYILRYKAVEYLFGVFHRKCLCYWILQWELELPGRILNNQPWSCWSPYPWCLQTYILRWPTGATIFDMNKKIFSNLPIPYILLNPWETTIIWLRTRKFTNQPHPPKVLSVSLLYPRYISFPMLLPYKFGMESQSVLSSLFTIYPIPHISQLIFLPLY